MTDRELLELAAKAAGIEIPDGCEFHDPDYWRHEETNTHIIWNPLGDDGDALRLAVKLGIRVETPKYTGFGTTCGNQTVFLDDPFEQTRHAIVRCAAEIGKQIQ